MNLSSFAALVQIAVLSVPLKVTWTQQCIFLHSEPMVTQGRLILPTDLYNTMVWVRRDLKDQV